MTAAPSELEPAPAGWVVRRSAEPAGGGVRIFGLAPEERLLRSLRRAGCSEACIVNPDAPPSARGAVLALRADNPAEVEQRAFDASYKGLTDLVTKWVWPRPARAATRWCAEHGVRPNAVTVASGVLAVAAALLFARAAFGAGLACAWAMTFLDTVDGKLARVTLTSSRLGDVMDHGLDLIHPPFWWWAWGLGLGAGHAFATAVVVIGYLVGRTLEGGFLARFGFEMHSWRPIDGLFRTITARRNPNLILLSVGAAAQRPDLGL